MLHIFFFFLQKQKFREKNKDLSFKIIELLQIKKKLFSKFFPSNQDVTFFFLLIMLRPALITCDGCEVRWKRPFSMIHLSAILDFVIDSVVK